MKYTVGQTIADVGFRYFERLHEPIFLVNRSGNLIKMNRAARKFMAISHLNFEMLDGFITSNISNIFKNESLKGSCIRLQKKSLHLLLSVFRECDLILVEVVH